MTPIKLDESIDELCFLLSGGWNRSAKEGLEIALRDFAEAVREEPTIGEILGKAAGEKVRDDLIEDAKYWKPPCDHNGKHLGQHCPELKLSTCKGQNAQVYCNDPDCGNRDRQGLHRATEPKDFGCSCGEEGCYKYAAKSPADLPDEVKEKIEYMIGSKKRNGFSFRNSYRETLESLARLCLSLRKP